MKQMSPIAAAIAALTFSFVVGGAPSTALADDETAAPGWSTGSSLTETGAVPAPNGFIELCVARPELCPELRTRIELSGMVRKVAMAGGAQASQPLGVIVDRAKLRQLETVNRTVNDSIRPRRERSGDDVWRLDVSEGDCEEYVLLKREVLVTLGWPRSALRIAVVRTPRGEDHAVLVVETAYEALVLDNLTDDVLGAGSTEHSFIAAQSFREPGVWTRVALGGAAIRTASVLERN